jgi:hypothetical protein
MIEPPAPTQRKAGLEQTLGQRHGVAGIRRVPVGADFPVEHFGYWRATDR